MLLGPLAAIVICVIADWAIWDWSISSDHGTIALIAGLAIAPLIVALAWYSALALIAAIRAGLRWAAAGARRRAMRPASRDSTQAPRRLPRTAPYAGVDPAARAERPGKRLAA
jgi:chromate transport protein ChrA